MADTSKNIKEDSKSNHFLKSIQLSNFLSFGLESDDMDVEQLLAEPNEIQLGRLNILVGPNGSGKTNLIESISLLRSLPESSQARNSNNTQSLMRRGGGVEEWIWKGQPEHPAVVAVVVQGIENEGNLLHALAFASQQKLFQIVVEIIRSEEAEDVDIAIPYYHYALRHATIRSVDGNVKLLLADNTPTDASIVSRFDDPDLYPELAYLNQQYSKIAIFREWRVGRNSPLRDAQSTLARSDVLEEDFSNLYLFLNHLYGQPKTKRELLKRLGDIYEGADDMAFEIYSQYIRLFLIEGDYRIPCERLSDGTLRYLCLMAILLNPTPPPLICIEEPELGLHPDMLPRIADLLIEASQRTQLIVTTHSDIIVDSMTKYPESVFIVEKHDGITRIKHPPTPKEGERLGTMWIEGQIGGTRW